MAKRTVFCPECGHKHKIEFGATGQSIGVRAKKSGDAMDYSIIAPEEILVTKFFSASDDALLAAGFAACCGIIGGVIAQALLPHHWPVETVVQTAITCTGIGGIFAYGWLCAEHNQRLKCVLPAFLAKKDQWAAARIETSPGNVELTVNHLHRDGLEETNRTIQRFGPLPVDTNRFNEWVQGALVGKSLGVTHWTPKAKMFTRPEYDMLMDHMTAAGIVTNQGSNKGNVLTGSGRRAFICHLKDWGIQPPSPVSENDFLGERLAMAQANNGGNTPLPHSGVCAGGQNAG